MSYEMETPESIQRMTIEELDLSVRTFNILKKAEIDTVSALVNSFEYDEPSFLWPNIGKKATIETIYKLQMLGCLSIKTIKEKINGLNEDGLTDEYVQMLRRINAGLKQMYNNSSVELLDLSSDALNLLQISNLLIMDSLLRLWDTEGVPGLCRKLVSAKDVDRMSYYNTNHVVWEIVIKLALSGCNVQEKITRKIEDLIEADASYSTVRFWQSLKIVLAYLPEQKYNKLKPDKFERYAKCYEYVARYILDELGETVGELLPAEDYIEVICSECDHRKSYYLKDIFNISCSVCDAKDTALANGFELYSVDECESHRISLDEYDWERDNDYIFFVCMLCQTVSDACSPDSVSLVAEADRQVCHNCLGKHFLTWISDKTSNLVEFDDDSCFVKFTDNNNGKTVSIDKEDLTPQKLWDRIIYGV